MAATKETVMHADPSGSEVVGTGLGPGCGAYSGAVNLSERRQKNRKSGAKWCIM